MKIYFVTYRCLVALTLTGSLVLVAYFATTRNWKNVIDELISGTKMIYRSIKIVDTSAMDGPTKPPFPCISTQIQNLKYPICTYLPKEDIFVSREFHSNTYFHGKCVQFIMDRLRKDARLQLVDIGANIGSFTLAVAHMKRRVLAVEPNAQTLTRLRTSIRLGNVSEQVTLLHNAVSNEHVTLRLGVDSTNRGDTFLLKGNNCTGVAENRRCVENSVDTITLDDLLPLMTSDEAIIKVDVQGAEMKVFHPATAFKFFANIRVPLICMEWGLFLDHYPDADKRKSIDDWLFNFFYRLNYTVHREISLERLGPAWQKWPYEVVFIKQ